MANVRISKVRTSAGKTFEYVQLHHFAETGRGKNRVLSLGPKERLPELVALLQSFLARQAELPELSAGDCPARQIVAADLGQAKADPAALDRQARNGDADGQSAQEPVDVAQEGQQARIGTTDGQTVTEPGLTPA